MLIPNQWYAALEAHEVKAGKPQSFKRLGQELVFWRNDAGQVVAMEDRCPHRQVKLSLGKIVDGCIECPFHGFRYDEQGQCQLIPANGKNGPRPKVFHVNTLAVREEHGFIWLWYGEARAEYPPVPFFEDLAGFSYGTTQRAWPVHYNRAIENQLDVAHLPFVHATSIGRGGQTLVNGPYAAIKDDTLRVWIDNEKDSNKSARKPSDMDEPNRPATLSFKFPNIWQLHIAPKWRVMVAFAPVDEENTMMYVRGYHSFTNNKLARWLISQINTFTNLPILKQDERVVFTHNPKMGGLDSGDKYIPADYPILLYYRHCEQLTQAANQEAQDLIVAKYSPQEIAS